ncbi:MAG: type sorting protein [Ferruginibacter sp.]|uniref:T9SS type A sorting domain-containing protein n=1 Tax=Ferruginibacter sp. TaxID=1940288 RepID=UPI00265B371C|nr:T9SS type A sorting domain-containing protein [Ferruginibacter sp.]MDB5278021.1 type sorting protein [Ferruginibacter sp.]
MKKLYYLLTLSVLLISFQQAVAQCVVSDLKIRLNGINPATCEASFDLSWTQDINSGNKFAYVHIWSQPAYHTPAANWVGMYSTPQRYPVAADLVNVLSTFVIDDNQADYPLPGTVYHPDPSYTLPPQPGLYIVKVHLNNTLIERMSVENIKVILPSCTTVQTLYFDVWTSEAANGRSVSCSLTGQSVAVNQLRVLGLVNCTNPPGFKLILQNNGPALDNVSYKVYVDYAPYHVLNTSDTMVFASTPVNLAANATASFPATGFQPYQDAFYSSTQPLLAEVAVAQWPISIVSAIESGCGALPVRLTTFTAKRASEGVVLNWQTASEQSNKGFEIQRQLSGGDFTPVGFVATKAYNGNSDVTLSYDYTDADNTAGSAPVFYRLKQVDINGKIGFSEIRVVRNNASKEWIIYPNPAQANVNVLIPAGTGAVDMVLNDMAGRVVKKWDGLVTEYLQINNVRPGVYVLNAFVKATGERVVRKIVIQ